MVAGISPCNLLNDNSSLSRFCNPANELERVPSKLLNSKLIAITLLFLTVIPYHDATGVFKSQELIQCVPFVF